MFAGKLVVTIEEDFYNGLSTHTDVVLKSEPGLSDEIRLCVSRRYHDVKIHEYGDLRGRDPETIQRSIGP